MHQNYNLDVNSINITMAGMYNFLRVRENRGTIRVTGMNQTLVVEVNNGTIECEGMSNNVVVVQAGPNGRIIRGGMNCSITEGGVAPPPPVPAQPVHQQAVPGSSLITVRPY